MFIVAFLASLFAVQTPNEPSKSLIVAVCQSGNQLVMIDPQEMKVLATIPTAVAPHEVITSRDGKTAYVAEYGNAKVVGASLRIIDLVERKVVKTVELAPLKRPHGMVIDDNDCVIFTAEQNKCVGRYDPKTDKVEATYPTGQAGSHMVARDAAGKLYTGNIGSNSVSMIDPSAGKDAKPVTFPAHMQPEAIAVSPDGKQIWAGHRKGGDIVVIDPATKQITNTIECGGVPIRLAFTSGGSKVLASEAESGNVIIYDAATKKELGRIDVGQTPVGITIAPDGKRAAVSTTGDGNVVIFDIESMKVIGKVEVGGNPDGIAWTSSS